MKFSQIDKENVTVRRLIPQEKNGKIQGRNGVFSSTWMNTILLASIVFLDRVAERSTDVISDDTGLRPNKQW